MLERLLKNKIYVYIILSLTVFYSITNLFSIASQDSISTILEATNEKKQVIFDYWLNERVSAVKHLTLNHIAYDMTIENKMKFLKLINASKTNKVLDVFFTTPDGSIITQNYEGLDVFEFDLNNASISGYGVDSSVYVKESRYSEFYNEEVMDIYAPMYNDGQIYKVAVETVSLKPIKNMIKNACKLQNEKTYICNLKGEVLFSTGDFEITTDNIEYEILGSLLNEDINMYTNKQGIQMCAYAGYVYENQWAILTQIQRDQVVNTQENIRGFFIKSWMVILSLIKILEKPRGDKS